MAPSGRRPVRVGAWLPACVRQTPRQVGCRLGLGHAGAAGSCASLPTLGQWARPLCARRLRHQTSHVPSTQTFLAWLTFTSPPQRRSGYTMGWACWSIQPGIALFRVRFRKVALGTHWMSHRCPGLPPVSAAALVRPDCCPRQCQFSTVRLHHRDRTQLRLQARTDPAPPPQQAPQQLRERQPDRQRRCHIRAL